MTTSSFAALIERQDKLTTMQIGILRDVATNKISLDDCGEWLIDQLVKLILLDGPLLIDSDGPSVFLTEAGRAHLATEGGGE